MISALALHAVTTWPSDLGIMTPAVLAMWRAGMRGSFVTGAGHTALLGMFIPLQGILPEYIMKYH